MDWTVILVALIGTIPSFLAWRSADKARKSSENNAADLKTVKHQTNTMQSDMMNMAKAAGKVEERADVAAAAAEKKTDRDAGN